MTALGALATVGLATTAVAQPKVDHRPDRAQNTQEQQRAASQLAPQSEDKALHSTNLVRALVCAGMYPNLVRVRMPDTKYDKTASYYFVGNPYLPDDTIDKIEMIQQRNAIFDVDSILTFDYSIQQNLSKHVLVQKIIQITTNKDQWQHDN